jgi:5'-nucleotidase
MAYAVAGKPTDAVIIGLYALKLKPDLIVSGVNIGENLSYESIMTSGTVGAALEGSNQGTKAIAFSLQVEDQGDKFDDPRTHSQSFEPTRKVVHDVVSEVIRHGFSGNADVINVNIPSVIRGGYEVTRLARKLFVTGVEQRLDPRGRPYYWINGPLIDDADEGTDVHAIRKGNISVTPITLDCTAFLASEDMKAVFFRRPSPV